MSSLLAKLERRLGGLAIERLPLLIVGGMAAAAVLGWLKPDFHAALMLNVDAVRHGQVWRLVTYLFLPRTNHPVWLLFDLYMTYLVGSSLEGEWGAFKLNLYYLVGMIGTTIAAFLTGGSEGNIYLNYSLFLAFATVFPDFKILVFFVIPIRMKWLGIFTAAIMARAVLVGDASAQGAVGAAMATYLLFFGGHLIGLLRNRRSEFQAKARREAFATGSSTSARGSVRPVAPDADDAIGSPAGVAMGFRTCAICGAEESEGADIRVCTCEKCGGSPRTLCLEHARNH